MEIEERLRERQESAMEMFGRALFSILSAGDAMDQAAWEILEDDSYRSIPGLGGTWADGRTLKACREELRGINVVNCDFKRLILSKLASHCVRLATNMHENGPSHHTRSNLACLETPFQTHIAPPPSGIRPTREAG
ncbi:MAG: hypothetical protein GY926_15155 [bacterium]|nr:hypothetical protein [bacterium]